MYRLSISMSAKLIQRNPCPYSARILYCKPLPRANTCASVADYTLAPATQSCQGYPPFNFVSLAPNRQRNDAPRCGTITTVFCRRRATEPAVDNHPSHPRFCVNSESVLQLLLSVPAGSCSTTTRTGRFSHIPPPASDACPGLRAWRWFTIVPFTHRQ